MKFKNRNSNNGLIVASALVSASILIVGFAAALASNTALILPTGEGPSLEQNETMPNFIRGDVVQSEYEQGFFVGSPSPSHFPSGQGPTLLGVAPTVFPARPGDINFFAVLVPAWGCATSGGGISCGLLKALAPAYDPSFAANETCLPATIQTCWDHPSTIGVPNSLLGGGTGFTVEPLPGHDHLIASFEDFQDVWWEIQVVLVFNHAAWPNAAGTHGIASVDNLTAQPVSSNGFVTESLIQAELDGDVFGPVATNTFLNFANLPTGAT